MATENDVLMRGVAADGNPAFYYPRTYVRNILDFDDYEAVTVASTMTASGWSSGVYSFESTYPFADYDITIEPNGDSCTAAQLEAWNSALLLGSATANKCKALGVVPTVNIPIIVKAVKKS